MQLNLVQSPNLHCSCLAARRAADSRQVGRLSSVWRTGVAGPQRSSIR